MFHVTMSNHRELSKYKIMYHRMKNEIDNFKFHGKIWIKENEQ